MSAERMGGRWHGARPAVRVLRVVGFVVGGVIVAAVFALAFGWLVMLLWNWLMPAIFHLGVITYWQAFGVVILAKLIFGAAGGGSWGARHGQWRGGPHGRGRDDWRYYREFWEKEGRQAFDRFVQERKTAAGQETPTQEA